MEQQNVPGKETKSYSYKKLENKIHFCVIVIILLGIISIFLGADYVHSHWKYFHEFSSLMRIRFDKDWDVETTKEEYKKWFYHEDYNWIGVVDGELIPTYNGMYPTSTGVPSIMSSNKIEPGYYIKVDILGEQYYTLMTLSIPDQNSPASYTAVFDTKARFGTPGWQGGRYVYDFVSMPKEDLFSDTKMISTDLDFIMELDKDDIAVNIKEIDKDANGIISGPYVRILGFEDWENFDADAWEGNTWVGGIKDE